jgi:hypothetical protein
LEKSAAVQYHRGGRRSDWPTFKARFPVPMEFQVLAIIGGQCSKLSSPVQSHHARRL